MRSLTARKLASWMPILHWLPTYQKSWFRFDLIAGLTVWALVVPQAIAYAQIANLPPQAGVFASFAAPLAYALFGTSRQLIVSPTSATAALSASMVAPLVMAGDAKDFAAHSAALAILCGLGFIVLGRFRMGFLSQFIAPAVQAGFLIGLGLTIIVGQISKMLGIDSAEGPFYQQFDHLIRHLGQTNAWSMAIGLVGIASILTMRRLVPTIPMALVLVVLAIVAVSLFNLDERGVEVVGHVDRALPTPALPIIPLHDWLVLVPGVSAIVVIGYSESMSVTRRFANEHKYRVNPDQELVALGASSLAGGIFQGFISAGGASQSAANDRAGAKTQMSSIVLATLALLSAIALMPLFRNLPQAILAAIVITAVMGFVDFPAVQQLKVYRRDSYIMAIVAMFATLLLGILPGLLVSIAISICVLLGNLARPALATSADSGEKLVLKPLMPISFVNTTWIHDEAIRQTEGSPAQVIVLDLSHSTTLDVAGIELIGDLANELDQAGKALRLINIEPGLQELLDRAELGGLVGENPERTPTVPSQS